ncbi:MAG TPA: SDR family NAD(P)-dependent oxidoreductase [Solirubrobacteraceae bacterium]
MAGTASLHTISPEEGLSLFAPALASGEAVVLPVRLDRAALRTEARSGALPLLLSNLAGRQVRRKSSQNGALAQRLDDVSELERPTLLEEVVRGEVAGVLGYSSGLEVDSGTAFKDLGFDSLAAVELRNRLGTLTGLRLPATLVFDYPTCVALADYLFDALTDERTPEPPAVATLTRTDEPIAIVGIGCRYPGEVRSAEGLWELVQRGGDGVSDFPTDRGWDLDALYDPDPERAGTSYTREGGFLYDAAKFDADFFGIGPREAVAMDPQQRLLLEVSWEALEDAGIDPLSLAGSNTGVFTGVMNHDYGVALVASLTGGEHEGYLGTGVAGSVASGRVAYTLGLEGPAMTVDTACSSSLVAIHLACQALRQGECTMALAGGVSVLSSPGLFVDFARQRALAPDGRCKSFSEAADGAGWSEGVGVLALERVSDARRLGHPVLALVRGSAVNQDGASNGLTAPNGPSQQRVIHQALASAGLGFAEVDAVEAHGTGTKLGDPIEAQALIATYGRDRGERGPLWVGSVKSNIGHSLAAAGAAGVIKMVMGLRHETLPRTIHAQEPTSEVDWSAAISLLQESIPWTRNGPPRRAGVSSFGISGTNAHLILEEAPAEALPDRGAAGGEPVRAPGDRAGEAVFALDTPPLVVSARGDAALRGQAGRVLAQMERSDKFDPLDVAYSLAVSRAALKQRAMVSGGNREELLDGLRALARGESVAGVLDGAAAAGSGRVVFVFPGQGAQWLGMAAGLLESSPVFGAVVRSCGEALGAFVDWSLEDVLRGVEGAPGLDRVDVVQPVLFGVMVSLAGLWRECGVEPAAVVGHSQGEIAAAHIAGGLSLQDAARLVVLRSRALVGLMGRGGMASVALAPEELEGWLERCEGEVSVAAVNGPRSVVVSGERRALDGLLSELVDGGVRAREIPVGYASHSAQVEEIRAELLDACAGLAARSGEVPFISTVTGEQLDTGELDGEYWYRNLREPVRFEGAVRGLLEEGYRAFVEISPHPVLTVAVQETVEEALPEPSEVVLAGSLRRDQGDEQRFLASLGEVWVRGVEIDWERVFAGSGARRVELPPYAFQRERYWLESSPARAKDVSAIGQASAEHPLLGAMVALPGEGWLFTGQLSMQEHPWLADHAVLGRVLLPGTAFLELAAHAGARLGCEVVRELILQAPLVLQEHGATRLQMRIGEAEESGARSLSISSHGESGGEGVAAEESEWVCHALGSLVPLEHDDGIDWGELISREDGMWPPIGAESLPVEDVYDRLAEVGLEYGPVFQGLTRAWKRDGEIFAEVSLGDGERERAGSFGVHPALLDAALHTMAFDDADAKDGVLLPFSWNDVALFSRGASALRVRMVPERENAAAIAIADQHGRPVVSVGSLVARGFSATDIGQPDRPQHESLFGVEWIEHPGGVPATSTSRASTAFGTCSVGIGEALRTAGVACEVIEDVESLGEALERGALYSAVLLDARADQQVEAGREESGAAVSGVEPVEAVPDEVRTRVHGVLGSLQTWLEDERLSECRLMVVTQGAIAVEDHEDVGDLAGGAVWGLVRSAQLENPDRFVLVDVDGEASSWDVLSHALALDEPQLTVRRGTIRVARLGDVYGNGVLALPQDAGAWKLDVEQEGTLEGLAVVASPEADRPLAAGEVRVEMRATGLNFRDVLVVLGMYPGAATFGGEGAGVVVEVGRESAGLVPGQRVMGVMEGAMGTVAVADARAVVAIPEGWSYAQAASMPIVFATAYRGLVDLAGLKSGERLLVHAGTGGVGMAATQIARHLGAEVYATTSAGKRDVLRDMGFADTHMASSRTLDFRDQFLAATDGEGMDVVLNSLAGKFVDTSFELLPNGGRFLEMGKTDIRDGHEVGIQHPGVVYRAFDLMDAGLDRLHEILLELVGLFESGALALSPVTMWNARRPTQAFRHMSQGQHVGKNVLRLPSGIGSNGTVLITGGTGELGAQVARHLVIERGVRHLVLASRRGSRADGANELLQELSRLGAQASVIECDVSSREQVQELLAAIPAEHPLNAVIHSAGVLDDGVIASLTPERVDRVLTAKVDGAWHLHELTSDMELSAFVLFSSVAGVMGGPGQANYAAANAFLDALAVHRQCQGLAATSIAWGLWEQASGMTGHLTELDHGRVNRLGVLPLSNEEGLALLDEAIVTGEALVVSARLDMKALRARARDGELHSLLRELIRVRSREDSGTPHRSLAQLLEQTAPDQHETVVLELVRSETARVLGHRTPEMVDVQRPFKELGFDSLAAVELRNRLATQTGMRLPATLAFDYPTLEAVAVYLLEEVSIQRTAATDNLGTDLDRLQIRLSEMSAAEAERSGIATRLQSILSAWTSSEQGSDSEPVDDDLSSATDDEIFDLIDREFGDS